MKLTIQIQSDNEAFQPRPEPELARILENLAELLQNAPGNEQAPAVEYTLWDLNGNRVGTAVLTE